MPTSPNSKRDAVRAPKASTRAVAEPSRRPYNGASRRERAAETRDRIVSAGCEHLHRSSVRDWRGLTIRAVAERAGVNERTVYRHFGNERGLRDAVMKREEEDAGIDLAGMQLDDIADIASRIFDHVSSYPPEPRPPLDPTLAEANQRQRDALLGAIAAHAAEWPVEDRTVAAAMFDVLWSLGTYERLVVDWQVDEKRAIGGIAWVIGLVEEAVRKGRGPG
jgi:AcrR family transcriptional regulator